MTQALHSRADDAAHVRRFAAAEVEPPHSVKLLVLVAAFLLLRIGLAPVIPLSIDEAYAVVVSRGHSLSYFDHPPVGFALARFMADLVGCECPFAVRFPFVLLGSLSALLLFDLTRLAYGPIAAFWAAAWYSVAPFFLISAGHFVVPDGPLNFFVLASAWLVAPMLLGDETKRALLRWVGAGLMLGLALMSKYQAGLFAISAVLILALTKSGRAQLQSPGPWIAAMVAALGLSPVILWNMRRRGGSTPVSAASRYCWTPSRRRPGLRIREIPYVFKPRVHGQSTLDSMVALEYVALLVAKAYATRPSVQSLPLTQPARKSEIGSRSSLQMLLVRGFPIIISQTIAMTTAMAFNYSLNNALTYRDLRRRGWRFLSGFGLFAGLCGFGVVAGVGVSSLLYTNPSRWWVAGLAAAAVGASWNYMTNSAITWRLR